MTDADRLRVQIAFHAAKTKRAIGLAVVKPDTVDDTIQRAMMAGVDELARVLTEAIEDEEV